MRAHTVALVLVLDAEEIAKAKCSMNNAEVILARQAVEERRGLVVIVNKMDLLSSKENSDLCEKVSKAVTEETETVIPQITSIPVVFISALEGKGRITVMRQVPDTYEKWCLRLPTARLSHWLKKVKGFSAQPKIKYFTQVKARPLTFVAFASGKVKRQDTDIRFLTKSLKEDFNMGRIPIRIMQRVVPRREDDSSGGKNNSTRSLLSQS